MLYEERERGITISSAAISFQWENCDINLIDTPVRKCWYIDRTSGSTWNTRVMTAMLNLQKGTCGLYDRSRKISTCDGCRHHYCRCSGGGASAGILLSCTPLIKEYIYKCVCMCVCACVWDQFLYCLCLPLPDVALNILYWCIVLPFSWTCNRREPYGNKFRIKN